jgi:hypothetical protein
MPIPKGFQRNGKNVTTITTATATPIESSSSSSLPILITTNGNGNDNEAHQNGSFAVLISSDTSPPPPHHHHHDGVDDTKTCMNKVEECIGDDTISNTTVDAHSNCSNSNGYTDIDHLLTLPAANEKVSISIFPFSMSLQLCGIENSLSSVSEWTTGAILFTTIIIIMW